MNTSTLVLIVTELTCFYSIATLLLIRRQLPMACRCASLNWKTRSRSLCIHLSLLQGGNQ